MEYYREQVFVCVKMTRTTMGISVLMNLGQIILPITLKFYIVKSVIKKKYTKLTQKQKIIPV